MLALGGNAKYQQLTIPPEEAQLLQTRQFNREELISVYAPGLPHHLVGITSKTSNYGTGIEQQMIHFLTVVLGERLARFEDAITTELLPEGLAFRFDSQHLQRLDSRARSEWAAKMRQWGLLSAEDLRILEGQPERGIDDDYLVPANMIRISAETGEVLPGKASSEAPAPGRSAAAPPPPGSAAVGLAAASCECGRFLGMIEGGYEVKCSKCGQLNTMISEAPEASVGDQTAAGIAAGLRR